MTKIKTKSDLEFTLGRIEIGSRKRYRKGVHLLDVSLLWPRIGISMRSASRQIVLQQGVCDLNTEPWHRRIFFKETCTDTFALYVNISVSMNRSFLRSLPRKFAGYIFKTAGDVVDDLGIAGEVAEQPLKEISRTLLKNDSPAIMGHGECDLTVSDFSDGTSREIAVDIFSGDGAPGSRAGKHIGKAVFNVRSLS